MRKAKLKFMNTVWEKKGNSDIQAVRPAACGAQAAGLD